MNAFIFELRYADKWTRQALRREALDAIWELSAREEQEFAWAAVCDIFRCAEYGVPHVGDAIKQLERYRDWVFETELCDGRKILADEILSMFEAAIDLALSPALPATKERQCS
jgi:hypothetical protein